MLTHEGSSLFAWVLRRGVALRARRKKKHPADHQGRWKGDAL